MINVENAAYTYMKGGPFEISAVKDISLKINDGEFVGLIGHTGSGKSTLIQMLAGLLKPTDGKITINGHILYDKSTDMKKVRFETGLVMQYPEYQLFEDTVFKDIAFGPSNMGLSKKEIDERVYYAADLVGLDKTLLEKSPFDLSGGQKRRVAIAGIIAMTPKILILDEPAAGLDPAGRDEILYKIGDLHKRMNITVILVSHSMEDIAKLAERIIVLNSGKIVIDDALNKVFMQSDLLKQNSLSIPEITKVVDKLRKSGLLLPEGIFTVDYAASAIKEAFKQTYTTK